jgi:hypothetical protein
VYNRVRENEVHTVEQEKEAFIKKIYNGGVKKVINIRKS